MPSVRFLARRLADRAVGTAFDRAIARLRERRGPAILFCWNRGLGDIALGLVPLFLRIRRELPGARIVVVTREELREPFAMTPVDSVQVVPGLEREARIAAQEACERLGIDAGAFDAVFEYPDPNRWLEGRRREYPPRLNWNPAWDELAVGLLPPLAVPVAVAHVSTETQAYYGYRKDWPAERWRDLIGRLEGELHWVLVGSRSDDAYGGLDVTDLRGRTDFPTLMALVRHRARLLVAPDSGVLTMAYYLEGAFDLDIVSLWSDPRQGVLLQDCDSPNPRLRHEALRSPGEDLARLEVDTVEAAVRERLAGFVS